MGFFDFLRKKKPEPSATYSGGSGSSIEDAVVITSSSSFEGVPAEYAYIETQCGREEIDWTTQSQVLVEGPNGKMYDELTVKLKDESVRKFYFDINSFYGKI
jgi:hypothetical protein